jgi:hypothetical protein
MSRIPSLQTEVVFDETTSDTPNLNDKKNDDDDLLDDLLDGLDRDDESNLQRLKVGKEKKKLVIPAISESDEESEKEDKGSDSNLNGVDSDSQSKSQVDDSISDKEDEGGSDKENNSESDKEQNDDEAIEDNNAEDNGDGEDEEGDSTESLDGNIGDQPIEPNAPIIRENKSDLSNMTFQMYTDGTFYIEGRCCQHFISEHQVYGIKVNAHVVDTMASNVPSKKGKKKRKRKPKPKKPKEKKKVKQFKTLPDGTEEVVIAIEGESEAEGEEVVEEEGENTNKEEGEEEEEVVEDNPTEKKRKNDLISGGFINYTDYPIYGQYCAELTSPYLKLLLAIKPREIIDEEDTSKNKYDIVEISSVIPFSPIYIKKFNLFINKNNFLKYDKTRSDFLKLRKQLNNRIKLGRLANQIDMFTKDVPLTENLIAPVFENTQFWPIFKNAFKPASYFKALELFGISAVKNMKVEILDDLMNNREENTKEAVIDLAFSGSIKDKAKELFVTSDPSLNAVFEAASIYHLAKKFLLYRHTCLIEKRINRKDEVVPLSNSNSNLGEGGKEMIWSAGAIDILQEVSKKYDFTISTLHDSTLHYLELNTIRKLQETIRKCVSKYYERKVKTRSQEALTVIHTDDVECEDSGFTDYIQQLFDIAKRGKKMIKVSNLTILTSNQRYDYISGKLGTYCNVYTYRKFVSIAKLQAKKVGDDNSYYGEQYLQYVFIDSAHLLGLEQMAEILGLIDILTPVFHFSLTFMGNAFYIPNELGCPFRDIYDGIGKQDIISIGVGLFEYGISREKIADKKVYTDTLELADKLRFKEASIHLIHNKKENVNETVKLINRVCKNGLCKAVAANEIQGTNLYKLVIVYLDQMNRSDLAVAAASLQKKGKLYFFGATDLALSLAYNRYFRRTTSLRDILKREFTSKWNMWNPCENITEYKN